MLGITDFILLFLIFVRISSALISAPIFGSKAIPVVAKLFISLIVAYIVYLTVDRSAISTVPTGWALIVLSAKEAVTGLIIGFTLQFVFYGVTYAGTLIGFDMQLSAAEVFNPTQEMQNSVIGEFLYYGALLVFFLINGHHYLISSLKYSFSVVPIGRFSVTGPVYNMLILYSSSIFVIAVKIASPVMVSFFLFHIAEGILARIIPQMQVFFVTQPVKIALGLALLSAAVPIYIYVIRNLLQDYEGKLSSIIQAMGV